MVDTIQRRVTERNSDLPHSGPEDDSQEEWDNK